MVTQVKDYDAALDLELDSMDKFVLQCLAFYQVCYTEILQFFAFFNLRVFNKISTNWLKVGGSNGNIGS
jgi:hypothetical protein